MHVAYMRNDMGFPLFLRRRACGCGQKDPEEGVVFRVLIILTIVELMLTHANMGLLIELLICMVILVIHVSFQLREDFFLNEDNFVGGILLAVEDSILVSTTRV
jgi:hypothetical protein